MGSSNVLKLLKIAQAVGLLERIWSTLNVRHLNLRSNLQLSLSLFKWFVHLIWLIIIPSQFNILTCCYFTYRHQNHQVIFQESVDYKRKTIYNTRPMYFEIINPYPITERLNTITIMKLVTVLFWHIPSVKNQSPSSKYSFQTILLTRSNSKQRPGEREH